MKGFNFWQFMAGITVFVYAMSLIETAIKNLAGRSFKKFLQKQSQSKVKMIAASTTVTAILQSSSVVLLMVLSFVGAGLMNMRGALAAVLGSNLGTTLDSWVIAIVGFKINLGLISYPFLGISLVGLLLFRKNTKLFHITTFLIGFAFIFIALEWLKGSVDKSLESYLGSLSRYNYYIFIPIGFLITAIIQSSSATIAITLAALYNHLFSFESAAAIVIGSELGTTLKFLLGSIGGIPDKKRVAWGNFILNLVTMIIAALLLSPLVYIIQHVFRVQDQMVGLVVFQTSINILSIIIFYPVLGIFAGKLEQLFKENTTEGLTKYIRKTPISLTSDALELAQHETLHLMHKVSALNKLALGIEQKENNNIIQTIKKLASDSSSFLETYSRIKLIQGEILEYIAEIPKNELSETEIEDLGKLINIIRHVLRSSKNLKDIRHNLSEFESTANDNLYSLFIKMKENENQFYEQLQNLLDAPGNISLELLDKFTAKNRKQYDDSIAEILVALKENKISELDSSNLLNVYREIYSSNKAIISALSDLKDLSTENS